MKRSALVYGCGCACVCSFRLITRRMNRLFNIDRIQLDTKRTSHSQSKSKSKSNIKSHSLVIHFRVIFSILFGPLPPPLHPKCFIHPAIIIRSFFRKIFTSIIQLISKLLLLLFLMKFFPVKLISQITKEESHQIFIKSIVFNPFFFSILFQSRNLILFIKLRFEKPWKNHHPHKKVWCSY